MSESEAKRFKNVTPRDVAQENLFPVDVTNVEGARIFLTQVVDGNHDIGDPVTVEAMNTLIVDIMADPDSNRDGNHIDKPGRWAERDGNRIIIGKTLPSYERVLEATFEYQPNENLPRFFEMRLFHDHYRGEINIASARFTLDDRQDFSSFSTPQELTQASMLRRDPAYSGYHPRLEQGARWVIANILTFKEPGAVGPNAKNAKPNVF